MGTIEKEIKVWQSIKTQNGRFLVKAPNGKAYYTDEEGNFLRTAHKPEIEWQWALKT